MDLGLAGKLKEKFDAAAKALGLDPKTSELLARSGSIPGLGNANAIACI